MKKKSGAIRLRKCLFCDNPAGSEEHIISEWLAPLLLGGKDTINWHPYSERNVDFGRRRPAWFRDRSKKRPGPARTRRVKAVCPKCNGGWMSVIESDVAPAMTRLIRGDGGPVTTDEQLRLARWAVLKAIVNHEHFEVDRRVLDAAARNTLSRLAEQADGWAVWIALREDVGRLEVDSSSLPCSSEGSEASDAWLFTATFALDHLIIHVRHARPVGLGVLHGGPFFDWLPEMAQVFPVRAGPVQLASYPKISDADRRLIVTELGRHAGFKAATVEAVPVGVPWVR